MRLGIKFFYLFFFSGSFIWGQVKIGDNVEVLNPAAVSIEPCMAEQKKR